MKKLFILASIVILSLIGIVGIQNADATICSSGLESIFTPSSYDKVILIGTVEYSEIIELDPPAMSIDNAFYSKRVTEYKIDEQIYGDDRIFESDTYTIEQYWTSPSEPYEQGTQRVIPLYYYDYDPAKSHWGPLACFTDFDMKYVGYVNWIKDLQKDRYFKFSYGPYAFANYEENNKSSLEMTHLENLYENTTYDFSIKYPESWIETEYDNYDVYRGHKVLEIIFGEYSSQIPQISIVKSDLNGYDIIKKNKMSCANARWIQDGGGCGFSSTVPQNVLVNDKPVTIHQYITSSGGGEEGDTHKSINRQVIIDLKTENSTWIINGEYYFRDYTDNNGKIDSFTSLKNIINSFKINNYEYDWYHTIDPESNVTLNEVEYHHVYSKTDDLKISITNNLMESVYSIEGTLNFDKSKEYEKIQCFNPVIINELKVHQTKQLVWDLDKDCSLGVGRYYITLQVDYSANEKSTTPVQEFMALQYFEPKPSPIPNTSR